MRTTRGRGVAMAVVLAGAAACASGTTMETAGGEIAPDDGTSVAIQPVTASALFMDANIAAMGSASNQEEIQASRVAVERAADQRVKAFAQRMIDEHTRVEQQMAQMLAAKGMAPMDNAYSAQVKRNLPPTLEMLRGLSGREFDAGYMLRQVAMHEMTLLNLDTTMIPEADDPEMKSFLQQTVRPAVQQHLAEAKALHEQLK